MEDDPEKYAFLDDDGFLIESVSVLEELISETGSKLIIQLQKKIGL